ncbi:HS2ST1 [Lepeophtheirus salmonis]|uniref:HS2ST1 n=1 Tax=Lepeophtheirus salmonis TaxID=72036 RepID=A0A7R8CNV6_LEPSM|nr:HS2ST1 [Lepeophtheirus salmonis]CAF2876547.1 HS2ST1 [Lepeophtheirus salmonis]
MGDKVTFDECVEKKLPDCDPKKLWIQVPWFCGHFRRCSEPGSRWALEQAKLNVARSYFLVGLTEDLEGAGTMYRSSGPKKYVRKTRHKDAVSEATIEALRNTKIWRIENEFYEFVASHYRAIKGDLESQANSQKLFHYQKVRP